MKLGQRGKLGLKIVDKAFIQKYLFRSIQIEKTT